MNKRIFLSPPHMSGKELEYIQEAFDTNWIAPSGPNVMEFEKAIAQLVGMDHAAALVSATSAIHLSLKVLGVQAGDTVFCSSLTFAGSCNPILYEGAEPVFIDSEPTSWNMSPIALKKAMEDAKQNDKLPKAVIVVNLYGQNADMDKLNSICDSYGVPVIEDAAESLGATYKGKPSGTLGKVGIYSFNGNKIITSSGGGMIVSNDKVVIDRIRFLATQARDDAPHYQHSQIGYNYRMSNIVAGVGRGQLTVLNDRLTKKKYIYNYYKEALQDIDAISMMPIEDFGESNYWLSVITIDENSGITPTDIFNKLEQNNIESRPAWKPMHLQPLYSMYKYFTHYDQQSVSDEVFKTGLCLPSGTAMTDEELNRVIKIIKSLF